MSTFEGTLFDLTGKVAVVTGGSKGIGRAICERLAQHGARVVVSSRKLDACEVVAEGIRARGGEAVAQACHIGRKEDLKALVEGTAARWGSLDVLVCNAAVNPYYGPSSGIPDDAFDRIMASNIKSNLWLCNMVFPGMAERGGGSAVIVSSIGGFRGSTTLGAYAISKAADMQLARNLACEWGPKGIRVNCIAPGLVKTDFARALWENPENAKKRTRETPLKRLGEPDDIAAAALYLASPAAAYVTGKVLEVDGGIEAPNLALNLPDL
jgi:NAD(P)-dependent dehydrogenase (short-subunit alcohol dehydrogenase family)